MIKPAKTTDGITQHGFRWGQIEIIRVAEIDGNRVLWLKTPKMRVQIRVTPSGFVRYEECA